MTLACKQAYKLTGNHLIVVMYGGGTEIVTSVIGFSRPILIAGEKFPVPKNPTTTL